MFLKMKMLYRIILSQNAIMLALADIATDEKTKKRLMNLVDDNKKFLDEL